MAAILHSDTPLEPGYIVFFKDRTVDQVRKVELCTRYDPNNNEGDLRLVGVSGRENSVHLMTSRNTVRLINTSTHHIGERSRVLAVAPNILPGDNASHLYTPTVHTQDGRLPFLVTEAKNLSLGVVSHQAVKNHLGSNRKWRASGDPHVAFPAPALGAERLSFVDVIPAGSKAAAEATADSGARLTKILSKSLLRHGRSMRLLLGEDPRREDIDGIARTEFEGLIIMGYGSGDSYLKTMFADYVNSRDAATALHPLAAAIAKTCSKRSAKARDLLVQPCIEHIKKIVKTLVELEQFYETAPGSSLNFRRKVLTERGDYITELNKIVVRSSVAVQNNIRVSTGPVFDSMKESLEDFDYTVPIAEALKEVSTATEDSFLNEFPVDRLRNYSLQTLSDVTLDDVKYVAAHTDDIALTVFCDVFYLLQLDTVPRNDYLQLRSNRRNANFFGDFGVGAYGAIALPAGDWLIDLADPDSAASGAAIKATVDYVLENFLGDVVFTAPSLDDAIRVFEEAQARMKGPPHNGTAEKISLVNQVVMGYLFVALKKKLYEIGNPADKTDFDPPPPAFNELGLAYDAMEAVERDSNNASTKMKKARDDMRACVTRAQKLEADINDTLFTLVSPPATPEENDALAELAATIGKIRGVQDRCTSLDVNITNVKNVATDQSRFKTKASIDPIFTEMDVIDNTTVAAPIDFNYIVLSTQETLKKLCVAFPKGAYAANEATAYIINGAAYDSIAPGNNFSLLTVLEKVAAVANLPDEPIETRQFIEDAIALGQLVRDAENPFTDATVATIALKTATEELRTKVDDAVTAIGNNKRPIEKIQLTSVKMGGIFGADREATRSVEQIYTDCRYLELFDIATVCFAASRVAALNADSTPLEIMAGDTRNMVVTDIKRIIRDDLAGDALKGTRKTAREWGEADPRDEVFVPATEKYIPSNQCKYMTQSPRYCTDTLNLFKAHDETLKDATFRGLALNEAGPGEEFDMLVS